jgi:hypothetical protein
MTDAPLLTAEDGADFTAVLEAEGPEASFTVTWEAEDEDRTSTESDQQHFGTEAEAIAWLDTEAARRSFAHYPMTRTKPRNPSLL